MGRRLARQPRCDQVVPDPGILPPTLALTKRIQPVRGLRAAVPALAIIEAFAGVADDGHEVGSGTSDDAELTVDYDAQGRVIGIDIEHAATRLDLGKLLLTGFPGEIQRESA
jgi:YD repeat-containing protein